MVNRLRRPLFFFGTLFVRFHLVPFGLELVAALRRKPWFFAVAALMVGVVVWNHGAANWTLPAALTPSEGWLWAFEAGWAAAGTAVLSWPLGALAQRRREFYSVRPWGARALVWYGFFRLAAGWSLVSVAMLWLFGAPGWVGGVAWLATGPGVCWALARWRTGLSRGKLATVAGFRVPSSLAPLRRLPAVPAWWASHPGVFFGPFAVSVAVFAWALAGGAGFVWSDHPPVAALLEDFLWPTLFGLVWADVGRIVPLRYFQVAKAPLGRVLGVLGGPVLVQTAVILFALSPFSASPLDALRTIVLNLSGTAFWFFFGLKWSRATLLTFALSWALLVVGVALDRDWWWAWALALALGAAFWAGAWAGDFGESGGHPDEEDDDA